MMNIQSVSFHEACPTISVEFALETTGPNRFHYTLLARVVGDYRAGSAGNPDAYYIHGLIRTAVDLWSPAGVIIDFSRMKYEWGDMLELIYDAPGDNPTAYIVGKNCRKAMSTLEFGEASQRDITESAGFFETVEEAMRHLRGLAQQDASTVL